MIPFSSILVSAALCSVATATVVQSGKARIDWITSSSSVEAGKSVNTGLRMVLDEGWHTYWSNPGEGGMKISVDWELPAGWKVGELEHPVPIRFLTGELPGFGYEGTVVFPVTFTAPADFQGEVKLKGKVSWLTCNDTGCIPGNANLELNLAAGAPQPAAEAVLIENALETVPKPKPGFSLDVVGKDDDLILTVTTGADSSLKISEYEIYPVTPQVVDNAAKFEFTKDGDKWTARVPKSEYAPAAIAELDLVLADKERKSPVVVSWKSE